jgi:AcrR family transcriptional regulator
MIEKKRRFKPDVRKFQIIEVTKQLILEKGLAWATVMRIADALNISHTTLYYHFKNRREILLETFKSVMDEIVGSFTGDMDDVMDFFHKSAITIYEQARKNPKLGRLFLELLCAPPEEIIYDEAQKQLSGLHSIVVAAIQKGIRQGIFREDTDAIMVGWQLMSFEIVTFLGSMLELPNFITMEQGLQSVELILESIKKH